jgi:hypothetical protein
MIHEPAAVTRSRWLLHHSADWANLVVTALSRFTKQLE